MRRTDLDFARFLYHAVGSASEVDYLLLLSRDLEFLNSQQYDEMLDEVQQIMRMLTAFINRLNASG